MKITRSKEGVKITLPKNKINVRKLTGTKNSYQYTCSLPPLLCSFFGVGTVEMGTPDTEAEAEYKTLLMFYELEEENIIIRGIDYYNTVNSYNEHTTLEMINNTVGYEADPELVNYCNEHPINFNLFDIIHYKDQYNTRIYKLQDSNSYRVTLPSQLFKKHINHNKPNYIQFTLDTSKEDIQSNKGLISYEVIN